MKVLHLIDTLELDSAARQLQLLAANLCREDCEVEVACLGAETPGLAELRQRGVIVHALQWTRWVDPSVLWNLRAVVEESTPDVIHVWRLPALRALALAARPMLPRAIVTAPFRKHGKLAWWDRWLLNQVRCVTFAGPSERDHCLNQGVTKPALRLVSSAVAEPALPTAQVSDRKNVVYVGKIERADGARHAVWAFDILRHLFPEARLTMVGAESNSTAVRNLADGLEVTPFIRYVGVQNDLSRVLAEADVVWLPRLGNCGRQTALETMAHGRVVIGSDVPCLREVIRDEENGFLVPIGSVMDFARRTRLLFQEPDTRERMQLAARQAVVQSCGLDAALTQWREAYQSVAA